MSRDQALAAVATFPQRLHDAAVAAASRPTPAGEWGPTEVVRHLIAVEGEVHLERLRQVALEDNPQWAWTEPGLAADFDGADLATVLEAFAEARGATVELVLALGEDGWDRFGTHATYGRLTVEGLLRLAADHDAEHLGGLDGR